MLTPDQIHASRCTMNEVPWNGFAWAWGIALGTDGNLWKYDQDSDSATLCCEVPVQWRADVQAELEEVNRDRYAEWPTVQLLLQAARQAR